MKYEVYESYHLVPFEGYVDKVSNNNISLRTWYSSPIDQARVAVFNIRERVWWEAPNISNPLTSLTGSCTDGDGQYRVLCLKSIKSLEIVHYLTLPLSLQSADMRDILL